MSGFKRPNTPLAPLLLCCCLLTLSGIILGHEHGLSVKVSVKEGSDAVLPCSLDTKEDITAAVFDWQRVAQKDERQEEVFLYDAGDEYNNGKAGQSEQFRGRVSHFQDQLKHGNASIIITKTKKSDRGNYTCHFPRLQTPQIFSIQLVVELLFKDRSGGSSVATPKPFVTILDAAEGWALLQCEVRGASPKPEVEWQNRVGNKLPAEEPKVSERGGSYDVTLNITVNKTDRYRCVVEQDDMKHRVTSEVFVHISEKVCEDSSTTVAIGWLALAFVFGVVVTLLALFVYRRCVTIRRRKNSCHQEDKALLDKQMAQVNMENAENGLRKRQISSCEDASGLLSGSAEAL